MELSEKAMIYIRIGHLSIEELDLAVRANSILGMPVKDITLLILILRVGNEILKSRVVETEHLVKEREYFDDDLMYLLRCVMLIS